MAYLVLVVCALTSRHFASRAALVLARAVALACVCVAGPCCQL